MATGTTATAKQTPTAPTPTVVKQQESPLAIAKRTIVDVVAAKVAGFVKNGEIDLPSEYSVNNAIKAAWLVLQETEDKDHKKALDVCTRDSIANALLDMVVQGLNPVKNQVYFIVYGKTLTAQRSYFGSMAVAKMVQPKIDDFAYAAVYEGDAFKYGITNGKKNVLLHEQELGNVDKKNIIGAYAIALDNAGDPLRSEIMTFEEIKQAWRQSKMHPVNDNGTVKADSVQGKFTADMAMKTVVNKLCKAIVNASSDKALLREKMNRMEDLSDRAAAEAEIEEQANAGEVVDITPEPPQVEDKRQDDLKEEEMAPAACPDSPAVTYKKTHCDAKCKKRKGCPVWDALSETNGNAAESKKTGPGF